ncbi:filamentous hemagglutinin [Heyndrickxia coagulans]|nr:filamentous hemagglutinin [Heyndrickxia coagulans]QAU27504.1 filamentous hemagglutinin [Heyndrickxia coagulans]RCS33426.1 filamentous hemagglutinin [Heyndrickxia coagulans]
MHKDHLEVIEKNGKVKYVFKFGWNFNAKKAFGRIVKRWRS